MVWGDITIPIIISLFFFFFLTHLSEVSDIKKVKRVEEFAVPQTELVVAHF